MLYLLIYNQSSQISVFKYGLDVLFAECVPGLALLHGGCVSRCPDTFYVESRGQPSLQPDSVRSDLNIIHYVCMPCHYSCQTCSGPMDDECSSCFDDAKIHREATTTTDKAHCYPSDLMTTLDTSNNARRLLFAVLVPCVIAIIAMSVIFCCDCCRGRTGLEFETESGRRPKGGQPYERISEEMDDDEDEGTYYDQNLEIASGSRKIGRGKYDKQTHLEFISEDDEQDEIGRDSERLLSTGKLLERTKISPSAIRSSLSRSVVPPPKVPLALLSHTSGRVNPSNKTTSSESRSGPLV